VDIAFRWGESADVADRRTFLSVSAAAAAAAPVLGGAAPAVAAPQAWSGPGQPAQPQPPDAQLRALLREIDARRIEATVRKLASFGTRHTLSSQDDPVRGIGAARDWIFDRLTRYAAASGGRMTVEKQTFIQPVSSRIPVPTPITNIIATLRWAPGTEPDLAGYEVVWRESTAPDWTHVIAVGNVSTATVDLAKDNVQFGVRAVDTAGHRSPAAAPQPSA
jgi:hypothetical protein